MKRYSRRVYEFAARNDWTQSRMLIKLAKRHRRRISRLVSTRIRNQIRNGETDYKYSVY